MTVVAFHHAAPDTARFFDAADMERLRAHAELRFLGSNKLADIRDRLADVDILTGSWGMPVLSAELLDAAPRLKAVTYAAGTVKGFATPAAFARGLVITTAMHANAVPVAEVTVALIVLANKRWFACQDTIRRAAASPDPGTAAYALLRKDGHRGNYGASVGLVGFGAIGREVALRLRAYDLKVLAYDPHADAEAIAAAGAAKVGDLVDLARRSQILSLHAPNIPACARMIGARVLAALPDGATFINTARGALVDEAALIAELKTGRISAMLDVTDPEPPAPGSPLYALPNCWLTPHRAGSSGDEIRRMGRLAVDETLRILDGQPPRYRVLESMLATMA